MNDDEKQICIEIYNKLMGTLIGKFIENYFDQENENCSYRSCFSKLLISIEEDIYFTINDFLNAFQRICDNILIELSSESDLYFLILTLRENLLLEIKSSKNKENESFIKKFNFFLKEFENYIETLPNTFEEFEKFSNTSNISESPILSNFIKEKEIEININDQKAIYSGILLLKNDQDISNISKIIQSFDPVCIKSNNIIKFNATKCDPILFKKIKEFLMKKNLFHPI